MLEVSEIGLKEDELDLELGLSIGGSFRKLSETPKPAERESGVLFPLDSKISNGFHSDLKENQTTTTTTTSRSSSVSPTVAFQTESAVLDPKTKCEIHALRRQEAKKKQKEKRCQGSNNIHASDSGQSVQLEDQIQQRATKREKMEISTSTNIGTENVFNNGVGNGKGNPNSSNGQTVHCPAVGAVEYPFAPFQFVPYANGFAYPCVVPCRAPPAGCGSEKSVFQQVACRGFRPFVAEQPSLGLSLPNGCDSEKSGGKDGEVRKTATYASPVSSSSTVSDNHNSSSHEGDGSSETRTPSSHSLPEQNRRDCPKPNDNKGHSSAVQSTCSHQAGPAQSNNIDEDKEEAIPVFESPPLEKPISTTENPSPSSLKDNMGKPPRPQFLNRNTTTPPTALLQMPCVSTRGNGPNGKTIRGFLYRYTNSEVSIVCVCHGSTFSPAEFVQHAGGTDVSHPLKHITVIPSAFG